METLTLDEILAATGGRLGETAQPPKAISGLSTDSRALRPGDLYVPLVGQRFDGHTFIGQALEHGAALCLAAPHALEHLSAADSDRLDRGRLILVDDTLAAYHGLAAAYRRKFDLPVVGVTGSNGKTTTRDLIAALLSTRYSGVLKTRANLNNEFGVPQTIFQIGPDTGAAVIEMAMRLPGEIRPLARIAHPQVGIITHIGEAHLERLKTVEAIADAKGELLEELAPGGVAILPRDSAWYDRLAAKARGRVISFGRHEQAEVRVLAIEPRGFEGTEVELEVEGRRHRFGVPLLGEHNAVNFAGAVAVLRALGHPPESLAGFERSFEATSRRLEVLDSAAGFKIVNDVYNASPDSVRAALATLATLPVSGRRAAVLGDMFELGPQERELHRKVGRRAGEVVAFLVTVGALSEETAAGAREAGMDPSAVRFEPSREAAARTILDWARPGDVVLVKASRGMQLDEVVRILVGGVSHGA